MRARAAPEAAEAQSVLGRGRAGQEINTGRVS